MLLEYPGKAKECSSPPAPEQGTARLRDTGPDAGQGGRKTQHAAAEEPKCRFSIPRGGFQAALLIAAYVSGALTNAACVWHVVLFLSNLFQPSGVFKGGLRSSRAGLPWDF